MKFNGIIRVAVYVNDELSPEEQQDKAQEKLEKIANGIPNSYIESIKSSREL